MQGPQLKRRRVAHGIAGDLLCRRAGLDRNRLFRLERGYIQPSAAEEERLDAALTQLIEAKEKLAAKAREYGCPELIAM